MFMLEDTPSKMLGQCTCCLTKLVELEFYKSKLICGSCVTKINKDKGRGLMFSDGDIVKHLKSGKTYTVYESRHLRLEATNEPAYCYSEGKGSTVWIRSAKEMEDGRFVKTGSTKDVDN